jgi:hypothetical protein
MCRHNMPSGYTIVYGSFGCGGTGNLVTEMAFTKSEVELYSVQGQWLMQEAMQRGLTGILPGLPD